MEAAREAKTALAFSESLSHFERALVLLDTVPNGDALLPGPRYQLLRRAGEVAHLSASPRRAAELLRMAIDVVDPADRISHAYLYERLGRYLWMDADGRGAMAAYERAIALLPEDGGPTRWRAAVLSGYSQILMLAGRYQLSERYAREAIEVAGKALGARSIEGPHETTWASVSRGPRPARRRRRGAHPGPADRRGGAGRRGRRRPRTLVNLAAVYRHAGMHGRGGRGRARGHCGVGAARHRTPQGRVVSL